MSAYMCGGEGRFSFILVLTSLMVTPAVFAPVAAAQTVTLAGRVTGETGLA